ncbi:MAG TPA: RluA family pseudouridine synthase [Candidatus Scatomorpha gallistercoris]|nr:RluA family pseudouridine synthase [Candidatus Scatomorpha gallistercoris]
MKEIVVRKNDANQRLDRFVGKAVPLLPESLLQKYIRLKRIKLNGKGAKRDTRLNEGDVLSLYINDEFFEAPREDNSYLKVGVPKLDIVYEDGNIILCDKAPGVLCHSAGKWDYNTLIANIQAHAYQRGDWRPREENAFAPALCNRIDRNTGGIVIAAKNAEALRIMNEKIASREIEKYYLCVVTGRPRPAEGKLEGFLFKDAAKNRVYVRSRPEPGARTAVTYYKTLASRNGLSLVECRLGTGRTHQIRAQMAAAGTPLLGDGKYGDGRRNRARGEEEGQLLYSYRIDFDFRSDAGELNYLKGASFKVQKVGFVDKYFPGQIF